MPKAIIKPSPTSINSIDVTVHNESHTAAAPLVERMLQDPDCAFAAYKITHPNDDFFTLKIQGNEKKNAKAIFEDALRSIIKDIDDLIEQASLVEE